MNIILVTTSFNDEVHGTFNDKKTGCGINLLKPENVSRYRRGGKMTDLGELTCEKCKTKIAKEMIRSDQKEMKALLKEERMRAKKGIEDEGIVPLGNTTARITPAQHNIAPEPAPQIAPEPAPVPQKPAYQPNGAPALDDSLAQFAINKPAEKPEVPSENQFIPERQNLFPEEPAVPEPTPAPAQTDDFLAQFAIQKPDDEPVDTQTSQQDDFLAQFAISAPEPEPEQPAAPPVIDDISGALAAMDQMQQGRTPEAAPAPDAAQQQYTSEWDMIANQFFGGTSEPAQAQTAAPAAQAPVLDDISPAPAMQAPVLDDISPAQPPVIDDIAPIPAYQNPTAPQAPVIDDISSAAAPQTPVLDEILPVGQSPTAAYQQTPVIEELASPSNYNDRPVLEDIDDDDDDELEYISETLEPKSPVLNDINDAISAMDISAAAPQPVAETTPAAAQSTPVLDDISSALSALNAPVQPVAAPQTQPVAPVQPVVTPQTQPVAPVQPAAAPQTQTAAPVQPVAAPQIQPVAPVQPVAAPQTAASPFVQGQIISVPQITGYDMNNQPVYSTIQMQVQGIDANGQPILAPLPGQNITIPSSQPSTFAANFKNSRLQNAIAAANEIPTSVKEMTEGQKIAAANAAKGSPLSANVSKIATNPHARSTSQAFISAISVSKEYADKSLTDTQGLQQRTGVLDSVEDVLAQLGDSSLKEKKLAAAKQAQSNVVTSYQEYKAPSRTPYTPPARNSSPVRTSAPSPVDNRPLTRSELKAKKKQDKIDAKFQREMAKRK